MPTQHHDGGPTDHNMSMLAPGSEGEGSGRRCGRLEMLVHNLNPWFFIKKSAPVLMPQTTSHC